MTVAVSIAAAVAALYSYFPGLFPYRLALAVGLIWCVTWGNLRGVRATGRIFTAPTYLFLASIAALVVAGAVGALRGSLHPLPPPPGLPIRSIGAVGWLLVLHAYASGTTALTGVEAISNGVSVFRPVEWVNARRVLTWMGGILAVSFGAITVLAWKLHPVPTERKPLVSEIGAVLFGHSRAGRAGLFLLQAATTMILVLAANTSFSDFPRLANFHAGDGFLPRPLRRRGSRLVFSTGILSLACLATAVILVVGAEVHRLIPLYAVGVFASFTFSQAGMTVRHLRLREPRWRWGLAVNAAGAAGSGLALIAIIVSKFTHGAWVVAIIVPSGVKLFLAIRRHCERADAWLAAPETGAASWARLRVMIAADPKDVALADTAASFARRLGAVGADEGDGEPGAGPGSEPGAGPGGGSASPVTSCALAPGAMLPALEGGTADDTLTLVVLPRWPGDPEPRPWSQGARLRRRALRLREVAVATLTLERGRRIGQAEPHAAVVVVERPDGLARRGLAVARTLRPDEIHAVRLDVDSDETQRVAKQWARSGFDVRLEVILAPYREPGGPIRAEVEVLRRQGHRLVSVVAHALRLRWWQRPLYEDELRRVRKALEEVGDTAVIECRLPLGLPGTPAPSAQQGAPAVAPSPT